jgi:hypothetical protein
VDKSTQSAIFNIPKFNLLRRAKQWFIRRWSFSEEQPMPEETETSFDLSKIAKLNGDFRRNYGTLLGAFLYLRSISAARGRSWLWGGLFSLSCSVLLGWLSKHGFSLLW